MSVKLQPTSVIKANLGIEPNGRVQKYFAKRCADHMDKYVPYDEGYLSHYRIQNNLIIYGENSSNPYARYQYYGVRQDGTHKIDEKKRNRSMHDLATSYWDKKMVSAEIQSVISEVQDYINRGGK